MRTHSTPVDRDTHARDSAEALPVARVRTFVRSCHARMGAPLDESDLEDAVQEALLQAWRHGGSHHGAGTFDSWLYSVARYSVLRVLRNRRRVLSRETHHDEDLDLAEDAAGPSTAADTALLRIVRKHLRESGDTLAAIVLAKEATGATFDEIGLALSMTTPAVKSRYYRGLPGLKRRLRRTWMDLVGGRPPG